MFKINGVNIYIGWSTVVLILILIFYSGEIHKYIFSKFSSRARWLISTGVIFVLLLSLAFHEFAHYIMMHIHGVKLIGYGTFIFGAFVQSKTPLDQLPWAKELSISLSGPVANILLWSVFRWVASRLDDCSPYKFVLERLGIWNIYIGIYNLIPLARLDGNFALDALIRAVTNNQSLREKIPIVVSLVIMGLLLAGIILIHVKLNRLRTR